MDTIIKNGTIVTATEIYKADIGIKDEKIVLISDDIQDCPTVNLIEAKGKLVMPAGIDVHVHLELPFCGTVSKDDFENGTKAAACGGIGTVIDYAIQQKGQSILEAVHNRRQQADGKVSIDYSLHGGITDWEIAVKDIDELVKEGITSFKMFMVYKDQGWMAEDSDLIQALEKTAENGTILMVHAENDSAIEMLSKRNKAGAKELGAYADALSRPDYTELEAITRAVLWAEVTGGNLYIVHMSTGDGTDVVKTAQARGVNVFAETCPHYLLLDDSLLKGPDGHLYTPSPPLRKNKDQYRLWQGIQENTITVIGSDTCTFDTNQKALWQGDFKKLPFGLPGVETLLPLMHTFGVLENRISLNRFVQICSTNPAKLFGLYPQKGSLTIGADADIILFDPNKETVISHKNLQTNCDWSPYEGMRVTGLPILTLSRGKVVAENGKYTGNINHGKFIPRKTQNNYLDGFSSRETVGSMG